MNFLDRFMWWAPWRVTQPWKPSVFRGSDEWHNASVGIVVPFLGCFIFFYERNFNRIGEPHVWCVHQAGVYRDSDVYEGQFVSDCNDCIEFIDECEAVFNP